VRLQILAVGGLREKLNAAIRSGMTTVIMPEGSRSEYLDVPEEVRKAINVVFVKHYEEVFALVFDKAALPTANPWQPTGDAAAPPAATRTAEHPSGSESDE
jgi:ATP-dependent Lon protease